MCHALLIEDEWLIADHLASLIEEAGATSIDQVDSEQDAITAARLRTPEVIVSDVRLRKGTGPSAVMQIIAEHGQIPVIFVTGTPEECRPCAPPGVVLNKPVDDATMIARFREMANC